MSGERRALLIAAFMILLPALSGCSKPGVRLMSAGGAGGPLIYYTCRLCGSTKTVTQSGVGRSEKIDYRSPGFAACPHVWENGISPFAEPPIRDGRIILVKRGRALGALILRNQRRQPEHTDFEWYCRTDGKGTFRKRDAGLFRTGYGSSSGNPPLHQLVFRPFSVVWSPTKAGEGVVSYPRYAGAVARTGDTLICPTDETDITKIDATDRKWLYKSSIGDPGRIGTAP